MPATRRRLTAILAADVVEYSRLMGADEAGTHERLRAYIGELVDPKIREHQGFLVKSTGDGLLAEFPSVVDAVRCAVEIQREMAERNAAIPAERRIEFRMGINVGDVIAEPEDIFGDEVNIAARLEAMAEPGGIYISEDALRQVRGNVAAHFVDVGEHPLKNIARPLRVYRVDLEAAPELPAAKPAGLSISELRDARLRATVRTTLSRETGGARQAVEATRLAGAARWVDEEIEVGKLAWRPARWTWLFVALGLAAYLLRHEIVALVSAIAEFFYAKTSALPDGHEVTTATVITATSQAHLSAEQQPSLDVVDVSAFAPESGMAGSEVLVQVFLHRLDDAAIATEWARAADPDAIRRGIATLVAEIVRGNRVDILLEGRDTKIDEPLQSIIWRGEPCAAQFIVTLSKTTADRSCNPIGSLRFALKVSATTPIDPKSVGIRGDTAARYHRAFLSYATPDRPEVLKRAQALRAAHIEFFQDFLSMEPGERWEQQLYKEIDLCDLFLLFWSNNAARSEWVLREAELAVARQNASPDEEPDITPIILEGPPVPQPIPDFLKHLQFNDYLAYLIAATERERRSADLPQ